MTRQSSPSPSPSPSPYHTRDIIFSLPSQKSRAQATTDATMSTQRPFFLTSLFSALRATQNTAIAQAKHTPYQSASSTPPQQQGQSTQGQGQTQGQNATPISQSQNMRTNQSSPLPIPTATTTIKYTHTTHAQRRGSNSSSEGFRDVLGADPWYVGGVTARGEEQYFKLGVIRRVRSNDGLSLDRLSL